MVQLRKNNAGSGLVWAMAVGSFLLIIITALLSVSYFYSGRSLKNNNEQQAYLTARSGVDLIAKEFVEGSTNSDEMFAYLEQHGTWEIQDVGFPEEMGTCTLSAVLIEPGEDETKRTIEITARAVVEEKTQTVTATISGVIQREGTSTPVFPDTGEDGEPDDTYPLTWYVVSYENGGKEGAV